MNYGRGAFGHGRINQQGDTHNDERNRQELPHIQSHSLFELHLRLLDKLNKEPHSEAAHQEKSEEESAVHFVQFLAVNT